MIRSVGVVGAGVAGLTAALVLARAGHQVTLLERDPFDVGDAGDATGWSRSGIPHFLQPHAFIPRGRRELAAALPDVYQMLLDQGAVEVDISRKLPGPRVASDAELVYLAVRRPLIEWALRRAVLAQPRIHRMTSVKVDAIEVERGRATGLRVDRQSAPFDLVVDAHGRRTRPGWLGVAVPVDPVEEAECAVAYYSRYFRLRPGSELPDGPWFLSPRGDLGYLGFSTFLGDNRSLAAIFAVPPADPRWKALGDPRVFEAAAATIPMLAGWVDPAAVEPITGVMPIAGLRNTLRPASPVAGVIRVGDTYSHTDPTLAHGLAFGIVAAVALAAALAEHTELVDVAAAYAAATWPELRERYDWISRLDAQRLLRWQGEPVPLHRHDGAYELFCLAAGAAVATVDPDVFRVFNRRLCLLDRTGVLDGDLALRQRIEQRFAELRAGPTVPLGPSADELLAVMAAAVR